MDKDAALETLIYALDHKAVDAERTLLLNARYHQELAKFQTLDVQQYFYPDAQTLQAHGHSIIEDFEDEHYDHVLILLPKNKVEAEYGIARGLQALKSGGKLFCAAANKAGGMRMENTLKTFGLSEIEHISKHKARCCWAIKKSVDEARIETAIKAGQPQPVLERKFLSQPGIFGWNKMDVGSALLTQHLPETLRGIGADFGCGYGYLSAYVLEHCKHVQHLSCIDADARAIAMCKKNVQCNNVDFLWTDLTTCTDKQGLDFIVMNPPFHQGKATDSAIGIAFIVTAAHALKPGGVLWMVANMQLPYEGVLEKNFSHFEQITGTQGFKVLHAIK